jgi:hypothetical protein
MKPDFTIIADIDIERAKIPNVGIVFTIIASLDGTPNNGAYPLRAIS